MEWIEIIILRAAGSAEQPLDYLRQILKSLMEPGLMKADLLKHAAIPGDIALALRWQKENLRIWGSELAQQIIHEISSFGLIDHSIWIIDPITTKKNDNTLQPL
jgi:hypothetical protein